VSTATTGAKGSISRLTLGAYFLSKSPVITGKSTTFARG
jgi:hypothetical protein